MLQESNVTIQLPSRCFASLSFEEHNSLGILPVISVSGKKTFSNFTKLLKSDCTLPSNRRLNEMSRSVRSRQLPILYKWDKSRYVLPLTVMNFNLSKLPFSVGIMHVKELDLGLLVTAIAFNNVIAIKVF